MYGCESWTVKKAEGRRIGTFELWYWRRLFRVPWTARRSTLASHRPQTAKSCRSEWAVGQPQGGPWVEETWRGSGKYPWAYLLISLPPPARYITQQGNKLETGKSRVPPTVTNAVSWRSEGIKYKKNEVFIDVIESVNLLVSLHTSAPPSLQPRARRRSPMLVNRLPRHQCLHPQVNANGSVLLSEIVGSIKLKVFLSGMPELRLGLNAPKIKSVTVSTFPPSICHEVMGPDAMIFVF